MEPLLDVTRVGSDLRLGLAGDWTLPGGVPSIEAVAREIGEAPPRRLVFDTRGLASWDSALVTFAFAVSGLAAARGIDLDLGGLPPGARKLVDLAQAVPPDGRPRSSWTTR